MNILLKPIIVLLTRFLYKVQSWLVSHVLTEGSITVIESELCFANLPSVHYNTIFEDSWSHIYLL